MISSAPRRRPIVALLASSVVLMSAVGPTPASASAPHVAVDTKAPSAPTSLVVQQLPSRTATLSWGASRDDVGVVAYAIFRNGVEITTTTDTTITLTEQPTTGLLHYQVQAIDAAGNRSAKSVPKKAAFDTVKPSAPVVRGGGSTDLPPWKPGVVNSVGLIWTPVAKDVDVVQYIVYRNGVQVDTVFHQAGWPMSSSVLPLPPSQTTYWYQVQAVDQAGNRSVKSAPLALCVCDFTAPGYVTNFTSTRIGDVVRISWEPPVDDDSSPEHPLRYLVGINGVFQPAPLLSDDGGSYLNTYVDLPYKATGQTATLWVIAVDAAGNTGPANRPLFLVVI